MAYLTDHSCVDCGESNLVVLDFDHVQNKRWNVAYMVDRGFPWATIEDEIGRCEGAYRAVLDNCDEGR